MACPSGCVPANYMQEVVPDGSELAGMATANTLPPVLSAGVIVALTLGAVLFIQAIIILIIFAWRR